MRHITVAKLRDKSATKKIHCTGRWNTNGLVPVRKSKSEIEANAFNAKRRKGFTSHDIEMTTTICPHNATSVNRDGIPICNLTIAAKSTRIQRKSDNDSN